jgi:chromosome segregation ATPase
MINKWETLNNSFNVIGDQLAFKAVGFPEISQFSGDKEFRDLSNALSKLRNEIADLSRDINSQTTSLSSDMRYFFELSKDYDSELDIFRKGRDQAFQLYDKLSEEHRELLGEYECIKADLKSVSEEIDGAKKGQIISEQSVTKIQELYENLLEEVSSLRINEATHKKRIEILEEENHQLSQIQGHVDTDRNELIEQLAREIKSRNDALVLAEAARNELSRLLGESEQDRMGRDAAERARDEALGSVEGLNSVIEQLKQEVEEQVKMCRHETLMRHKVEEALLSREDELKQTRDEMGAISGELEEARKSLEEVEQERSIWREEKDNLTAQIGVLAQQMASDKLENQRLMDTLRKVQQDYETSRIVSDDAVEKTKQLERIMNQFIQDKSELEGTISKLEKEKAQIIQDSTDFVNLRSTLQARDTQLAETKGLFEQEKKLKEETVLALHKAEQAIEKQIEQVTKLTEQLTVASKERDEVKNNLEGIQKVLQSERQAKLELTKKFESVSGEVGKLNATLQQEQDLKTQALKSLEAETRSKQEAIRQLEDARKSEDKAKVSFDKAKLEAENLKDKLKEEERAKKDLNKQIEDLKKDLSKAATETEKIVRSKEEAARKADSETTAHKEADKALVSEKSEHDKTSKALTEEKSKREKLEGEVNSLKAQTSEAQKAAESERTEHGKTYKAYESEKSLRDSAESEVSKLKNMLAETKSNEQSLAAEKQANEKRIAKLEATIAEIMEAKDSVSKQVGTLASTKKQLEQAERVRADLESKLQAEKQKRIDLEEKQKQIRTEDEEIRIKLNNATLENEKLAKRLARLEGELDSEKRIKADLVAAIQKNDSTQ